MSEARINPKKRGLGRGLDALFEDEENAHMPSGGGDEQAPGTRRVMIGLDQLEPGSYQPRRHFTPESIAELAESINRHGILQPLVVRPKLGFEGAYEIVAGERRWRAAQKAQLHEVPVIVKELEDEQALEIALIENLQREDLNPVEEAQGYKQLMEEFGHTQEQTAKVLGKSRSHVANMVRLLTLPREVIAMISEGKLSAGHARTLITAENPAELARQIIAQGLNVRDAEKLAAEKNGGRTARRKPAKDVNTVALEQEIGNALGMKVAIAMKNDGKSGAGHLRVDFKSLDQLDSLLQRLSQGGARRTAE